MEEFELSKSNKKLPKPENRNSTKQDQHGAVVESGL
jgi:hypothetical protein